MTPNGQAGMQYPQPLQMSSCTTTVPNSVRNSEPVGHTSRHAAWVQCLQTSEAISQRRSPDGVDCSMNATCRQVLASSAPVLSNDIPSRFSPSSGTLFHSLQATSHALHPIQTLVSVKKPIRGWVMSVLTLRPSPVVGEVVDQSGTGRPAPRADVARTDLALLDERVRVERHAEQVVGRVAGGQTLATPVVRQPDLVHLRPVYPQWTEPLGDQHPRLDGGPPGHHVRPVQMREPA